MTVLCVFILVRISIFKFLYATYDLKNVPFFCKSPEALEKAMTVEFPVTMALVAKRTETCRKEERCRMSGKAE